MRSLAEKLARNHSLDDAEFLALFASDAQDERLFALARQVREAVYGKAVFIRGLIELSNYCRNDCYYCGIRRGNRAVQRYRLDREQVLACCAQGYALGFRSFVLQGGEDPYFDDARLVDLVAGIKRRHPDCALTLSLGERSAESYRALFEAGADRYLLRHESADEAHYARLHPPAMRLSERLSCLRALKAIGYQVGAGFMVGSPHQRPEHLLRDLRFLEELRPAMIGIGPFLRHSDTPFRDFPDGDLRLSLRLLAILRLMFPQVLLPATTALGTLAADGRELGLRAGANVVMPNLSPPQLRGNYALYDNKLSTGAESAEGMRALKERIAALGYHIVTDRGDAPGYGARAATAED